MLSLSLLAVALSTALYVQAVPAPEVVKRQSITSLSSSQISAFKPFTFFASAAYCSPSTTATWTCGANCAANSDFIPVASGGEEGSVRFWYVGFSPSQDTVIVAHQGTDTSEIEAVLTDNDVFLVGLDPILFPGISSVEVHQGFADEQAKTATSILAAVQAAIAAHSATKVTIVGHSLGAALALLDGVYLPLHISGVTFTTISYSMPRVGNQAFADYVDSHITLTHINNKEDLIPILPGTFLGFHHPSGEVHIMGLLSSPSTECIVGDVPNIFEGDVGDHAGPYDGVEMGC